MNEKILVGILRIFDPGCSALKVPIVFKIDKTQVPTNLNFNSLSPQNLFTLDIPCCSPLPVLIVASGDDSKEIYANYNVWLSQHKIENMEPGLRNLCSFENIRLLASESKNWSSVNSETFKSVLTCLKQKTSESDISEESEEKPMQSSTRSSTPKVTKSSKKNVETVEISSESNVEKDNKMDIKDLDLESVKAAAANTLPSGKKFALEVVKVLEVLVDVIGQKKRMNLGTKPEKHNLDVMKPSVRASTSKQIAIPMKDGTYEKGSITFVEGVLPLSTKDYKAALDASKNLKNKEPSILLANLVKYAFPNHWVFGVTLRGHGGNKSLIKIWNYANPLKLPYEKPYDQLLGEKRLKAFINHILRKTGRSFYDNVVERHLNGLLAKSLHYYRNKRQRKNKKKKYDDDTDSEDEGSSEEDPDFEVYDDEDIVNETNEEEEEERESEKRKKLPRQAKKAAESSIWDEIEALDDGNSDITMNSGCFNPVVEIDLEKDNELEEESFLDKMYKKDEEDQGQEDDEPYFYESDDAENDVEKAKDDEFALQKSTLAEKQGFTANSDTTEAKEADDNNSRAADSGICENSSTIDDEIQKDTNSGEKRRHLPTFFEGMYKRVRSSYNLAGKNQETHKENQEFVIEDANSDAAADADQTEVAIKSKPKANDQSAETSLQSAHSAESEKAESEISPAVESASNPTLSDAEREILRKLRAKGSLEDLMKLLQ